MSISDFVFALPTWGAISACNVLCTISTVDAISKSATKSIAAGWSILWKNPQKYCFWLFCLASQQKDIWKNKSKNILEIFALKSTKFLLQKDSFKWFRWFRTLMKKSLTLIVWCVDYPLCCMYCSRAKISHCLTLYRKSFLYAREAVRPELIAAMLMLLFTLLFSQSLSLGK
jgi:hypothetical protein